MPFGKSSPLAIALSRSQDFQQSWHDKAIRPDGPIPPKKMSSSSSPSSWSRYLATMPRFHARIYEAALHKAHQTKPAAAAVPPARHSTWTLENIKCHPEGSMLMLHGVCWSMGFGATCSSMKQNQKPSQEIWRHQDFHQINTTRVQISQTSFWTVPHGWGHRSKCAHLGPVNFPLSKVAWKHPRRSDRSPASKKSKIS